MILEGPGDLAAVPCLIAKTGQQLGMQIFAHDPIVCGGVHKLIRDGELERYAKLAASKPDTESILIILDLDDGCAAEFHAKFKARLDNISDELGKSVRVCFCVREYECWFLEDLENLKMVAPEYDWVEDYTCPEPAAIRGAKGYLNRGMRKHYKEITDQLALTRRLNFQHLFERSRSYRKFARALTGFEYDILQLGFELQ